MEFIQSSPCGVVIDLTFGDDDTIMDMNEIDVAGPSTHVTKKFNLHNFDFELTKKKIVILFLKRI